MHLRSAQASREIAAPVNIVDPILFHCKTNPDAPALCVPGSPRELVSYGQLGTMIHNAARKARAAGLVRGQLVSVLVKDTILHAAIVLGLSRLGIVTVSQRPDPLPANLKAVALITDSALSFGHTLPVIRADQSWLEGDGADAEHSIGGEDDVCRISLTTGTTGEAKGVAFTHRMFAERLARYDYIKGNHFSRAWRMYCDLGLSSSPGFRFLLYILSRGGLILFHGDSPEGTVQALNLYKIQSMVTAPINLVEHLKFFEAQKIFECRFDHISILGGPLSKSLTDRVRARMCPVLYASYGATEACTMASAPVNLIDRQTNAVGYVTPGVSIEIVDDDDNVLAPGEAGIVRALSRYNVREYVNDPASSAAAFRNGYFYPGDLGTLSPDGLLTITGRKKNILYIGGDKASPEVVESVLTSFPGVDQAGVVTERNELGIEQVFGFVVARNAVDPQQLIAHCKRRLTASFVPAQIFFVDAIPKNQMGRIDRVRLRELARPHLTARARP
jgi:acyl-CoA synthetase (AMP-forming)/AMP-acid ligase II